MEYSFKFRNPFLEAHFINFHTYIFGQKCLAPKVNSASALMTTVLYILSAEHTFTFPAPERHRVAQSQTLSNLYFLISIFHAAGQLPSLLRCSRGHDISINRCLYINLICECFR